jgi:hypothetical protein
MNHKTGKYRGRKRFQILSKSFKSQLFNMGKYTDSLPDEFLSKVPGSLSNLETKGPKNKQTNKSKKNKSQVNNQRNQNQDNEA